MLLYKDPPSAVRSSRVQFSTPELEGTPWKSEVISVVGGLTMLTRGTWLRLGSIFGDRLTADRHKQSRSRQVGNEKMRMIKLTRLLMADVVGITSARSTLSSFGGSRATPSSTKSLHSAAIMHSTMRFAIFSRSLKLKPLRQFERFCRTTS